MKPNRRILIPALIVILAAGGVTAWQRFRNPQTDGSLSVSGNIEITEARLAFRISGRLAERLVEEGESVQAGQLLARLEDTDQRLFLARAEAELAQAEARLSELETGSRPEELRRAMAIAEQRRQALAEVEHGSRDQEVSDARAELERAGAARRSAESQAGMARTDRARYEGLLQRGVVSRRESERFATAHETAVGTLAEADARVRSAEERLSLRVEGSRGEQVSQARAVLRAAEADLALVKAGPRQEVIRQAHAQVEAMRALRQQAAEQLGYTELRAAMPGIVLSKSAEAGEYLVAGTPVVSVGDLDQIWLRAYLGETDLVRVKLGDPARVSVDGLPGRQFNGSVRFIASEAEFTPKAVQTAEERVKLVFRIKIALENPDRLLKPGMPADARLEGKAAGS